MNAVPSGDLSPSLRDPTQSLIVSSSSVHIQRVRGRRSLAHHYGGSLQFRQSLLLTGKIVRLSICPPLSASPELCRAGVPPPLPPLRNPI